MIRSEKILNMPCLTINGDISSQVFAAFKEAVEKNIQDPDTRHLVLDLKAVKKIYSRGYGVIIGAVKNLRKKDGNLIIYNISEKLEKEFTALQMDQIMPMYRTEEEFMLEYGDWGEKSEEHVEKLTGFEISSQSKGDHLIVKLQGILNRINDLTLLNKALDAMATHKTLTLDFEEVILIDSLGIKITVFCNIGF